MSDRVINALARQRQMLLETIDHLPTVMPIRDHPWDGTLGNYFLANLNGHEREHIEASHAAANSLWAVGS